MKIVVIFLFFVRLSLSFDPHMLSSVELICYQCHAYSNNMSQDCDETFFKVQKEEEKTKYLFQCPYYQGSFCFKKVVQYSDYTEHIRGCSGPVDLNGNMMKTGCVTLNNPEETDFCLCDRHKCNSALSQHQTTGLFIVLLFYGLMLTIKIL